MVWKIILVLILLILLILFIPLRLSVSLTGEGDLSLRACVLGIPVYRSPGRQKKIRLRSYSPRVLKRRQLREERNALKKAKKAAKRAQKKPKVPKRDAGIGDKLSFITDLARTVAGRSLRRARVDVDELNVRVATGDAASTALLCGILEPALAFLFETLRQFSNLRLRNVEEIGISPDFTGERTRANIRFHFSMHVWHVFDIALSTLAAFVRHALKNKAPGRSGPVK